MPRPLLVEPGQRFGYWTIIRETRLPVASRPGTSVRAAVCKCDCGNESTTTLILLTSGGTRSCGCLSREVAAEHLRAAALASRKLRVRKGGRFGRLKVIDPDVRLQLKDRTVPGVQVRCDCGTIKIVSISHLVAGDIKSCGCERARGGPLRKWLADPANAAQIAATRAAATAAAREYARSPENLAKLRTMSAKRWENHVRKPRPSRAAGEPRRHTPPSRGPFAPKHGLARHPLYATWKGMLARCEDPRQVSYKNYGGRGIAVCPEWHDVSVFITWIEANLGPRPDGMTLDRVDNHDGYRPGNVKWSTWSEQHRNKRRMLGSHQELADALDTAMWCPTCGEQVKDERAFDRHYAKEHKRATA